MHHVAVSYQSQIFQLSLLKVKGNYPFSNPLSQNLLHLEYLHSHQKYPLVQILDGVSLDEPTSWTWP